MERFVTVTKFSCDSSACIKKGRYRVKCKSCSRTFHTGCVDLPDEEQVFTCYQCFFTARNHQRNSAIVTSTPQQNMSEVRLPNSDPSAALRKKEVSHNFDKFRKFYVSECEAICSICFDTHLVNEEETDPDYYVCIRCILSQISKRKRKVYSKPRGLKRNENCAELNCNNNGRYTTCYICCCHYHNACVGLPDIDVVSFRCLECLEHNRPIKRRLFPPSPPHPYPSSF